MHDLLIITDQIAIPLHEIEITASRSGGAGGQHVNKTNSKITLRWNIPASMALTDEQKQHLVMRLGSALTADGDLIISNSSSRSQTQNKKEALDQLIRILRKAAHVAKKRLKTAIPRTIQARRLEMKKAHGALKKMRAKKDFYE